jgi:uncharacterized repeat protein (TIGR02543 family)
MNRVKQILRGALWALFCLAGAAGAAQNCPAGYPQTTPDSAFSDTGNGTVRHDPSGLVWKRCAEGQTWNSTSSACDGGAAGYSWEGAFQRATAVNSGTGGTENAGHSDWRLPNVNELRSLVERACRGPAINLTQFPGTDQNAWFWSGSPVAGYPGLAWVVDFDYGGGYWYGRDDTFQVRLVRAGQYFYNFDVLNAAPAANSVAIAGTAQVGQTLTGSYTYGDTESDAQDTSGSGTSYRFVRSTDSDVSTAGDNANAASGTTGGTDKTYVLLAADLGKYLFYCVTPKASAGTTPGSESCSAATAAVAAAAAADTTPDAFSFTDQPGVARSTVTTSAPVQISGINTVANWTATGDGEACASSTNVCSPCDVSAWGTSGTVGNTQYLCARHTSSGSYSTAVNTTVTVGGVPDTFTSTTLANTVPTASPVTLTGTAQVGQTLTGSYTYGDTESDAQDTSGSGTSYRFVRSTDSDVSTAGDNADAASGTTGGTNKTYVLLAADLGKYLFYCVTPKASAGTTPGSESCSAVTPAVAAATYTVSYAGNGQSSGSAPVDASSPYLQGATVSVKPAGSLARSGYTFAGWNTAAGGGGTARAVGSTFSMGAANVTLYAQWTAIDYGPWGQSIYFGAAPSLLVGASGVISAYATSGLPVSLSSGTPGICSVSGSTVTALAVGTCSVIGNQAGNGSYYAASPASQSIVVGKGTQTINSGPAPVMVVGGSGPLSATASSGLPVSYSSNTPTTCTASGNTLTGVRAGIGACTVAANQAGNANYNAAPQILLNISIGKGNSTTTLTADPLSPALAGQTMTLNVIVTGAGAVPSGSVNLADGGITLGTVTLAGSGSATFAGNLGVGQHSLSASYAGDANYLPSLGNLSYRVEKTLETTVSVRTQPNLSQPGESVSINVLITPLRNVGTVSGTVHVSSDGQSCTITLPETSCALVFASQGVKNLSAVYSGNTFYSAGTGTGRHFVGKRPLSTVPLMLLLD